MLSKDARQLLVQSLTLHGATVTTAKSAEEALNELRDKTPDIIVSDIGMPEEDGYSLISKIRALAPEEGGRIPAVALTGYAGPEEGARLLSAGYQIHLAKPVALDQLVIIVADLAGRSTKKLTVERT